MISRSESDSHEIDVDRARLEKQLKTVFSPREAEALMHEIALLTERRGALDDAELSALEEQADIDDDLTAHAAAEDGARVGGRGRRGGGGAGRGADRRPAGRDRQPARRAAGGGRPGAAEPLRPAPSASRWWSWRRCTAAGARAATSTCRRSSSTRSAPRRVTAGSPSARTAGGCSSSRPVFFWFVGHGGGHGVVRVPRPEVRLSAADRRRRAARRSSTPCSAVPACCTASRSASCCWRC